METGVTNFLLENLGLVGVIIISLVCVILFLWREIKNGNKKQLDAQEKLTSELTNSIANNFSQLTQQLTSTLSSQNEKLLDIIQTFINNPKPEPTHLGLSDRFKMSNEINKKLKELAITCECDRAIILEFHNSNNNLSGFPFAKYTVTYEVLNKGVLSIIHKCVNMPYSTIASIVESICCKKNEDHIVIAHNNEEISYHSSTLASLVNSHADSILWAALFNSTTNEIIGLIALEYKHEIYEDIDYDVIKQSAAVIGELLTLDHYTNEND